MQADGAGLARILVAGTGDAISFLRPILAREAEVQFARSVEQALKLLDPGIDTVVCDLRFDDSRMFEFLQGLRDKPFGRSLRVLSIRVSEQPLSARMRNAITSALEALGVELFMDIQQVKARYGDEVACETLRQIILGKAVPGREFLLSPGDGLHHA